MLVDTHTPCVDRVLLAPIPYSCQLVGSSMGSS